MSKKGYKLGAMTEEHKRKIGDAQIGSKNHAFGKSPWNKGKKGVQIMSEETKKKMSETHKKVGTGKWMVGRGNEKHWNWKGGSPQTTVKHLRKNPPRPKPNECEVCGALEVICFDHDHSTGKFRGWICRRCNLTLGMVKDNSETLIALAEYLKNYKLNS